MSETESRQAEAVEVISAQFERMSAALDERLRDVEERDNSDDIGLEELRTEISRISEGLDERLSTIEGRESTALESVATEVAHMADKLETRVKDTEARSAAAIDQVGEQVARVSHRLESSQTELAEDLSERMDAVAQASKSMIDDIANNLGRKITDVGESAAAALGPVQNTVASLARRMETMEDIDVGAAPPPFEEDVQNDEAFDAPPPPSDENDAQISEQDIASSAQQARREFAAHLAESMADESPTEEFDETESSLFQDDEPEDDLPSVFDDLDAFDTSVPSSPTHQEFEADLPTPDAGRGEFADALQFDEGVDDDPFARSTVNSLDFLSAARKAALERGGDNRQITGGYGAEAEEEKKPSKLPMMAAGALAIAVAGGAGMTLMRGKQTGDEEAFAATPIGNDHSIAGEHKSASVDEEELFVDTETVSTAEASSAIDEDVLFQKDQVETANAVISAEPSPIPTPVSAARASASAEPALLGDVPAARTDGPRKISALEAFGAKKPAAPIETAPKLSLEQAAADGDPIAMHDLALKHLADGDKKAAAEMMARSANLGLTSAQYRLAKLYERGEGVPRSVKEARVWTEQAAAGGNVKAMHDLAVFFAEGEGGEQSYVGAVDWFTKAANHGLLDSQYNLGVLYEQGLGVSRNIGEAALWFEIAGRNGDADATRRARDLMNRLSPQEAETAKRRAAVFAPLDPAPRANGVFGQKSWEAPLKAQTLETQRLLNMLNYNAGPADGVMGARTRAAISRFEADHNLNVTGQVSSDLLDILRAQSISG